MIKKLIGVTGIVMFLFLGFIVGGLYLTSSVIQSEVDDISEHVGDTVVFNGDSTIIIDYSLLNETYTLQDGTEVSIKLYNLD